MRLTFLTHFPGRGGSTALLQQLRDFLEKQGHTTQVVCGSDDDQPQLTRYHVVPATRGRRNRRQQYLATIAATKPDLVYVISGAEEFDILRFLSVPRAHHISSLEKNDWVDIPRLIRSPAAFTELFTAHTPDVLKFIHSITGLPAENLALAPYRLDATWSSPPDVRKPHLLVRIAYCARLEPDQKRAHWLAEIIPLAKARGLHLHWDIVGDGPSRPLLEKCLAPFPDTVTFYGWQDRAAMKHIHSQADIFFLCSRWEGLPIAMAEGMTRGLASVVPSGPGGMEYAVRLHDSGWFYEAASPRACVDALSAACADLDRLHRKKLAAAATAREIFPEEFVTQELLRLEEQLRQLAFNGHTLDPLQTARLRATSLPRVLKRRILSAVHRFWPTLFPSS